MFIYELVFLYDLRSYPQSWRMHLSYEEWGKYVDDVYTLPEEAEDIGAGYKRTVAAILISAAAYVPVYMFIRNTTPAF